MSKALDIADHIAAHLNGLPALTGVTTLVDRQKDLTAEIGLKVAKIGGCVTILYSGFTNPDAAGGGLPRVLRRYDVTIYAKPILAGAGAMPADDILEAVATGLHLWEPDEAVPGFVEIQVSGGGLRGDKKFLIYDLDVEVLSRL